MKILWVSDAPNVPTGQGNQTRLILSHLHVLGHDVVNYGVYADATQPYLYNGIRVYPTRNFQSIDALRALLNQERPDVVVLWADARFFLPIFSWLDEFRDRTRFVFYHLWDNDPVPTFNRRMYSPFDAVVAASEFTYNLLSQAEGLAPFLHHIPLAISPDEFYPLGEDELEEARRNILPPSDPFDFLIFWNNRALPRKRPGDVLHAFAEFNKRMLKKDVRSLLVMNTRPPQSDHSAEDVVAYRTLFPGTPIFLSQEFNSVENLNIFYNLCDITCNFSFHEGFGLSVGESLMAGTPVAVTRTGGMPEQVRGKDGKVFGKIVAPVERMLHCSVGNVAEMPYIYSDVVSRDGMVDAFYQLWQMKKHGTLKPLGLAAREHNIQKYAPTVVASQFSQFFEELCSRPAQPPYRTVIL